jgi:hypothetical protein
VAAGGSGQKIIKERKIRCFIPYVMFILFGGERS